jgi:hypothetical protein
MLGVEMHHEGAFQDRLAFRLTKQLEGAARQISRNPLPEKRRRHFGMDEDELAVRIPVIGRRDGPIVNRPLERCCAAFSCTELSIEDE